MKKLIKLLITSITAVALLLSVTVFNVSAAAKVTVGGGEYNVGESVSISVKIRNDTPIMTAQININYNSSVLVLKSVSGAEYTTGNGSINIVDDDFSTATKDVTTGSYTLKFTAIAAGNSNISVSASMADKNLSKSTASASAAVTVTTPKPSSNANLASIKLSSGSLSPAFKANTTNYDATVKYSVEKITITGTVADGKSTYTGGGTFNLQVGNNERVLTVTAEDGTKKSYTINIKRMTEQETLDAEQAARDANPLLVIIDANDYTIVNEIDDANVPTGFTKETAVRKEQEITVLNSADGRYQLCWLVDANGENGAFYKRDENDNFTKLAYINANNTMHIIEPLDTDITVPAEYKQTKYSINGLEVDAIAYQDEVLADLYILNCYIPGNENPALYRYDEAEGTMQRAIDFEQLLKQPAPQQPDVDEQVIDTSWGLANMNKTGKIVLLMVGIIAIMFIIIAVLVIVRITMPKDELFEDEYMLPENNEFVLNDFSDDESEDNSDLVE